VIRPGKEKLFEQMYGPDGDWTQLFRHGKGYCGTRLTRDCDDSRRYVTLDFWESRADYERFISQHRSRIRSDRSRVRSIDRTRKRSRDTCGA